MKRMLCCLAMMATLAFAPPAVAQNDSPQAERDEIDAVLACRSIGDPAERVACFDRTTEVLDTSLNAGELVVMDREERRETRRGLFGFLMPKLDFLSDNGADEEIMQSTITGVTQVDRRVWRITIADGDAVWEMRSVPARFYAPKIGETVELEKAALNSYWVRIGSQNGIKGVRVK